MKIEIKFDKKSDRGYFVHINELEKIEFNGKVAIITNPKVSGLHLKTLLSSIEAKELYVISVADGEEYKNIHTIEYIIERLNEHELNRNSLLIAFGGGVIGDMTGFAASIFLRGIRFIQIPTTLLAQVDASVGGKTGVNNRFGKNLIGTFHQPEAVYCETSFLETLPKREFSAGIAEIAKMALTFDREFFEWLEKSDLNKKDDLLYAIKKSIEIKAKVVSLDEKESGIRAVLNYGHTFAHVIENETGYKRFLHGEAVGIGMVMANRLALKLGFIDKDIYDRVKSLLQRYNIPVSYEIEDYDSFYEHFFLDKKSGDKKIKFILLKGVGDYRIVDNLDKKDVISVLKDKSFEQ